MKQIVVVGAGPAGMATAFLLAQQGLKVTLLEQETAFDRVFRGEGLMPAGLGALYQMGLKETFEAVASRRLDAWDFYVGRQRRMRVVEPEEDGLATQIIDQGGLLKAIANKASQLPNFELQLGWQVVELLQENGSVKGVRASREGEKRDFAADCTIACDGRYSRLRKLAGLTMKQAKSQFDVLWFKLPAPESLQTETPFIACLQPDRQFAFYPSWDGRLQIGWIVEKSQSRSTLGGSKIGDLKLKEQESKKQKLKEQKLKEQKLKEQKLKEHWIEAFALALPPDLAAHFRAHKDELEGPIYLNVQVGCCEQWSVPGLLLIGDAAHPMAPNRAQGINMALRDAIVVANHFAALEESKAAIPHSALLAIQAARSPEIEAVQKMQLAEWNKVKFISQPGLPYWGFKAIATLFGRFKFAQNIWLHEQRGLRKGVLPVGLKASKL